MALALGSLVKTLMTPEQYVGRVLDRRYHILEFIAAGGMAWLYRAVHVGTERVLAVKILTEEARNNTDIVRRFQREARLTAKLKHENIVDIFDVQTDDDCYLVMELLVGCDLRVHLARMGRLQWTEVRAIMLQICDALHFAHEHGVVHRDLKPANCFRLEPSERVKVLDLGIAKPLGPHFDAGGPITKTGGLAGTPPYMAPEHFCGQIDARTDIYSAGVLMFELLTGRRPFRGKGPELLRQIVNLPMPSLASIADGVDFPPDIDLVVGRALAKVPEERYASMRAFADAIETLDAEFMRTQAQIDTHRAVLVLDTQSEGTAAATADPPERTVETVDHPTIEILGATHALIGPHEENREPNVTVSAIAGEVPAMNAPRPHNAPPAMEDGDPAPLDVGQSELVATLVREPPKRWIVARYMAVVLGCATAFVLVWSRRAADDSPTDDHPVTTIVTRPDGGAGRVIATDEPDSTLTSSDFSTGELGEIVAGESLDWQQQAERQDVTSAKPPPPVDSNTIPPLPDPQVSAKARRLRDANKAIRNVLVAENVGALVSQAKVTVRWAASGEVLEATVHSLPKGIERARVEGRLRGLQAPAGPPGPISVERTFALSLPE
jgi:serine/threonine protein kinase